MMRIASPMFAAGLLASLSALLLGGCGPSEPSPRAATLRITGTPSNAVVTLNGIMEGTLPFTASNLPAGRHLVDMRAPAHRDTLRTLILGGGEHLAEEIDLRQEQGLLLVHTDPPGAELSINGLVTGRTPLPVTDLPLGRHELEFRHPDALLASRSVVLSNREPVFLQVPLTVNYATLDVTSDPPGVNILINGETRGQTPAVLERLPTGEVFLKWTLTGYEPIERTLQLEPAQRRAVHAELTPIPGSLTLLSDPQRARVFIDNQFRGLTPLTLRDWPSGTFTLRLESPGHTPIERQISFDNRKSLTERFTFRADSGHLRIEASPPGTRVFVDGRFLGATESFPDEGSLSLLKLDHIPQGSRALEFSRRGYLSQTGSVQIIAGQTQSIRVELEPRFLPDTLVRVRRTDGEEVLSGVLLERRADGGLRLEVRSGVILDLEADDLLMVRPLSEDTAPTP